MNSTNSTAPVQQSAEEILRTLDLQRSLRTARREKSRTSRVSMLVAGLLLIVVAAGAALFLLEHLFADLRGAERPALDRPAGASVQP